MRGFAQFSANQSVHSTNDGIIIPGDAFLYGFT
jgi:hypothetical protein